MEGMVLDTWLSHLWHHCKLLENQPTMVALMFAPCSFVLNTHKEAGRAGAQASAAAARANGSNPDILDDKDLKRYIHYCRCKSFPRLSESAAVRLMNEYVKIRSEVS
jgi:hypothetical protein